MHGITDADVASARRFFEVADELLTPPRVGRIFVAHNASFDLGMLRHAFARAGDRL